MTLALNMTKHFYILILLLLLFQGNLFGQDDHNLPDPPLFNLLDINQSSRNVELFWSPLPNVSGYVIYRKNEISGLYIAIDSMFNPLASSYIMPLTQSGSSFYSEYFRIASRDTTGGKNRTSILSNILNTIYATVSMDTCKNLIKIKWNHYPSYPDPVVHYTVLQSISNGPFSEISSLSPDIDSLQISDFEANTPYCFVVRAHLKSGKLSGSNKSCILTKMQRPPKWINADYATVNNDKKIELSFHIDPLSEIKTFSLERKTGNTGNFSQIAQFTISAPSISYVDNKADIREINYYRLAALNNCGITVIWSNPASNIVLACDQNGDEIRLAWNSYRGWTGGISSYKLFTNTGDGFKEIETISPDDTLFIIKYSDIMYDVTGNEVCFILKALEGSNPYSDPGESSSPAVCIPASVVITVPDIFTPDGNGINDLFSPVLSFTPDEYYLLITDLRRRKVFESRNFNDKWDGRINGSSLPGGVYLWLLETRAPGGEKMTRSGTVTIVFNR